MIAHYVCFFDKKTRETENPWACALQITRFNLNLLSGLVVAGSERKRDKMASKFTSPEKKPPIPEIFNWADIEEIDLEGLSSDEDTEEIKASHAQLSFEQDKSPEPSPEQPSPLLQQEDTKSWHLKLPKFGKRSKLYQIDEPKSPTKKTKSISQVHNLIRLHHYPHH